MHLAKGNVMMRCLSCPTKRLHNLILLKQYSIGTHPSYRNAKLLFRCCLVREENQKEGNWKGIFPLNYIFGGDDTSIWGLIYFTSLFSYISPKRWSWWEEGDPPPPPFQKEEKSRRASFPFIFEFRYATLLRGVTWWTWGRVNPTTQTPPTKAKPTDTSQTYL
jgi:hypothetical protein